MVMRRTLFLDEEILLLALNDTKGTAASGSTYRYALAGAILAELLLSQRITVEASKKKLVDVVEARPIGDPLIDECLARIAGASRRGSLLTWVTRIAGLKRIEHRVAEPLCAAGVLRAEVGKVLLIFDRTAYPQVDPEPERMLIDRLRKAIFSDAPEVDPRTVVLVSLTNGAGLLKPVFGGKELKGRKQRIERLTSGDAMGRATKDAIDAATAIAAIAAIACTTAAVAASH
jgi:golgi phosphoprotein 3